MPLVRVSNGGTVNFAYPVIGIDYSQFLSGKSAMRTFRTTGNRTVSVDNYGICICGGSYSGSVVVYWESPFDLSGCTHGMCIAWLQSNDGASIVYGISLSNTLVTTTGTPQYTPYTVFEIPSNLNKSSVYIRYHHNHVSSANTAYSLLYDILFW